MTQRIVVILVGALFFFLSSVAGRAFAGEGRLGPPHIIGLALEPESVGVESPVKVTVTFIPCVDVDSLSISLKILPESDAQVFGVLQHGWHGKGKKGQAITLSGTAIFHRPGYCGANVIYEHREPTGFAEIVRDTRVFVIRIPGGIQKPGRREDKPPLPLNRRRTLTGLTGASGDSVRGVWPLDWVGPRISDSWCWKWRKFGPAGKDTLVTGLTGHPCSPGEALIPLFPGGTLVDSVVTGFVSPLSPPCDDTAQVIATCDILVQLGNPPVDASNWRVVPSWLGSIAELPDHRARFTAGSFPGIGNIWCDYGGYSYYLPVMVIANYHLEGSFLYKDRNLSQDLSAKRTLVALFTADPQANDLVLPVDSKEVHFRFVLGAYTNDYGFYQFDGLNVDSIAVLLFTTCSSHEVGYWNDGYWGPYGWYYYWFGFECLMHYQAPSVSAGSISASDDTRGALNIMSFTHTGVDYVAGLPGSHFPDKAFVYWNPDDPADTSSYYLPGYDFICVAGWEGGRNTDEWDQDVFLHEYGYFVMDNYAALPPVGPECQEHRWHVPSSDECAYQEGWATFYSCACQPDGVYLDTWRDGTTALYRDVELPSLDPRGTDVEGAVCASLWDVFDDPNDGVVWGGDRWCHNNDQNAGLWWQEIDEIWYAFGEAAYFGHFPYTVCEFNITWSWKGYPTDQVWQNIFNAHGIGCTPVGIGEELASIGTATPFLWPNHPNPFNPGTHITFRVSTPQAACLRLYNADGRVIRTLLDSHMDAGTYTMWWDGKDDSGRVLPSGTYLCHLVVGSFKHTRKLVLVK